MSKRYYLCNVLGDGSRVNPYRPAVSDTAGVSYVVAINAPAFTSCLVMINTSNQTPFSEGNAQFLPLPELSLDSRWNTYGTAGQRSALMDAIQARGLSTSGMAGTDPYRELIRALGKQLNPVFHEGSFDAG